MAVYNALQRHNEQQGQAVNMTAGPGWEADASYSCSTAGWDRYSTTSAFSFPACSPAWFLRPQDVNNNLTGANFFYTGKFRQQNASIPTYQDWTPGTRYKRSVGAPAPAPAGTEPTRPPALSGGAVPNLGGDLRSGRLLEQFDPNVRPPGQWQTVLPSIPFWLLPYRDHNPFRSPTEQTQRGYSVGVARALHDLAQLDPVRPKQPAPSEHPSTAAEWDVWANGHRPPGYQLARVDQVLPAVHPLPARMRRRAVRQAEVRRRIEAQAKALPEPATQTMRLLERVSLYQGMPPGAAGPTIEIGNHARPKTKPWLEHERKAPNKRTRQRKGWYLKTGHLLAIRRGVNPVTEALEVVECAFKSLPKGDRWKAQKESWVRQRAEAKAEGRTMTKKPGDGFQQGAPKIEMPWLPGEKGQSLTLPGGTRRPVQADLNADHIRPLSPQEKLAAIYAGAAKMDLAGFVACVGVDQVEDRIFGKLGQLSAKGARNVGWSHTAATGVLY